MTDRIVDIRCPYCRRWMTAREATTQGACDSCNAAHPETASRRPRSHQPKENHMRRQLFDVVIAYAGDDQDKNKVYINVGIIDRYHHDGDTLIAQSEDFASLDDAIAFAKGAVTAFMEGTEA